MGKKGKPKYSRRVGRKNKGPPHGDKPKEEGVGFTVEKLKIPGQENSDDPVFMYRVIDRYDGKVVFSGAEVESKVDETTSRQIWLLTKATGMPMELIETPIDDANKYPNVPNQKPHPGETPESTDRRLALEEQCAVLGKTLFRAMPSGVGFAFFMFNYGPGGNMAYLSSAQRKDMVATLREFIERNG